MSFNEGVSIDTSHASRGRGGGRGPVMMGGGIGTIIIVIIALFLGVDPTQLLGGGQQAPQAQDAGDLAEQCRTGADANTNVECRILATENSLDAYWSSAAKQYQFNYQRPQTVVFRDAVDTGCGQATSAVGPFYCPTDQTMYFDASFFDVLTTQFGSSGGPLAQSYVVAHEFGHHIENELGLLGYSQQDPQGPQSGAVRVELMADCLGGVWAHHAANTVDPDTGVTFMKPLTDRDIADALSAAASVGDDRIQEKTQGRVNPEGWTHGSAEQRQRWFTTGYQTGDLNQCNTIEATNL